MSEPVDIRCPECKHFLAEVVDYGRVVCQKCGWEVTVRSSGSRRLTSKKGAPTIKA